MRSLPFLLLAGFVLVIMTGEADAETSDDFNEVDVYFYGDLDEGDGDITTLAPTSDEDTESDCPQDSNRLSWPGQDRQWGEVGSWKMSLQTPGEIVSGDYTLTIWANSTQGTVEDVQFRITIFIGDSGGITETSQSKTITDSSGVATRFDINFDITNEYFNDNDEIEILLEYSGGDPGEDQTTGSNSTEQIIVLTSSVEHPAGISDFSINYYQVEADSYVTNFNIEEGNGLAGINYPLTFDLGMQNVPEKGTYRAYFNVSIKGNWGWGEVLELSSENTNGFYPVGTGYSVSGSYAYIDFNSSYNLQAVVIPWIPTPSRSDTYNISVEVSSVVNVDETNDIAYANIDIEKLTTNILVEAIKITESDGLATIRVTVGYPAGEQSDLDVEVGLLVYRASDYNAGNPPIDSLTVKEINSILRGDSRPISFNWEIISSGDYIFVASVDPENLINEINEADNNYVSESTNFGTAMLEGCTDPAAENYNKDAGLDDESCEYVAAIAGKNVTVSEGEVVQFSGVGTIESGTIVLYEWDFDGDGLYEWSSEENGITTFIYNDIGKYVATFRVTDNLGATATDNRTILVIAETDDDDDSGISVPSISLISSIAAIGIIALRRRY